MRLIDQSLGQAKPVATRSSPPVRYLVLLASTLLLFLTGAVTVLSASTPSSINQAGDAFATFGWHAAYVTVAVFVLLTTVGFDYRRWRRFAPALLIVATSSLVAVLLWGRSSGGSQRWLEVAGRTVQPSEIVKFALVVSVASFLDQRRYFLDRFDRVTFPIGVGLVVICALILAQPDLGTAIMIGAIAIGMMWAAGVPFKHLASLAAPGLAVGLLCVLGSPYRRDRVLGFLSASDNPEGAGWQVTQGLLSLANGGLRGTGISAGHAQWGWVPAPHTDFVFAVVGEQLGFIGALAVLILLGAIILTGFRTAQLAPDVFGSLLAAGISVWFLGQVVVNLGGVLQFLPITGVTLPFISYGGTALVVNALAAGVLLNVTRQSI